MKRIVICCDGTWKRVDSVHPTNVVKLAQATEPRSADALTQVTCHLDGVGTGRGTGRAAKAVDRVLGGLFGQGLMQALEAAYRFLMFNYAPGDEIFLFGYSRGAYTARSLAGMIRTCGLLERANASALPAALEMYRTRERDAHPDGRRALEFRALHSGHVTTSAAEADWRAARGESAGQPLGIAYLGVWDTVGALGLPGHLRLAGLVNRGLAFHDTSLSRMVHRARHAVAIDEVRRTFPPTLWDNLEALNAGARPDAAPYQQRWFPGDHASVGGGGEVTALSNDALLWIAEGAVSAGLDLDPSALAAWSAERDCLAPLRRRRARLGLIDRALSWDARDREGPLHPSDLAEATLQRWRRDPTYRPRPLTRIATWIDRQMPASWGTIASPGV